MGARVWFRNSWSKVCGIFKRLEKPKDEEAAEREQAAYYKGWQDGKNYYLEKFGGAEWTKTK